MMKSEREQNHLRETEFRRYLAGEMTAQEIHEFEVHCDDCSQCQRLLYRTQVEVSRESEMKSVKKILDNIKKKRQELDRQEPPGDFFGGRGLK